WGLAGRVPEHQRPAVVTAAGPDQPRPTGVERDVVEDRLVLVLAGGGAAGSLPVPQLDATGADEAVHVRHRVAAWPSARARRSSCDQVSGRSAIVSVSTPSCWTRATAAARCSRPSEPSDFVTPRGTMRPARRAAPISC